MSKRLIIIDLSNFIFRAYYAIRPLHTPDGTPVNAVFGVTNMMLKIIDEFQPDYILVAQDTKEKSFRHEMYEEYKANRTEPPEDLIPQFDIIEKMVKAMGMKCFKAPGFEADDIIGTGAIKLANGVDEVLLATGDKDLMQFVNDKVRILDTMKNKIIDSEGVFEKLGVKPDQIVDYLSLVGDSSDNIPGVRGIGAKGAAKMLAEYKDLDNIFANIDKFTNKRVLNGLTNHKEDAYLSKDLIKINCDVPVDLKLSDLEYQFNPSDKLKKLLNELDFQSLSKKIFNIKAKPKSPSKEQAEENQVEEIQKSIYKKIPRKSLGKLINSGEWGIYLEEGKVFFANDFQKLYYQAQNNLYEELNEIFLNKDLVLYTHLPKTTYLNAIKNNVEIECTLFDLKLAYFNLTPSRKNDIYSLFKEFLELSLEKDEPLANYTFEIYQLGEILKERIKNFEVEKVFYDLDLPLNKILAQMEFTGIILDKKYLGKLEKDFEKKTKDIREKILKEADMEVNLNSPKQVSEMLFDRLGLPVIKKTKTGVSTDSSVLNKLSQMNISPVPDLILQFREVDKLLSTYVKSLPQLIADDKRIHTHFRQTVAATGRLSSDKPNLQNIPIRTENGRLIRKAFVPKEGHVLFSADYSQVELRILAHFSKDPTMINAFKNDLDIHAQTASEIFEVPLNKVTSDLRGKAKAINFGLMYGQTSFGLSQLLNISQKEAKEYITFYFERFGKVKAFLDSLKEDCEKNGYAQTLFGRKRDLPDIHSNNRTVKSVAERMAINSPIQGTAADIIKQAMINVDGAIRSKNLKSDMLLQIHDELLFEVPEDELDTMTDIVTTCMMKGANLLIPLKVETAVGKNWLDAK